jgi:hypothetical protein
MKKLFYLLLLTAMAAPALAQQPMVYTFWVDGVLNAQLPKSNLYGLGTGLRVEVGKPLGRSGNALFAQAGYTYFSEKSAFTANIGLVNIGYRYQSRKAFNASLGVGMQFWSERMRIRFPDYSINETLDALLPSATVGLGVRLKSHYRIGLEYRLLVKPETGMTQLRNNVALSIGYTF